MRDISSALYGLESPSMRSRDPDGVASREIDAIRLEPAGSRSEAINPGPEDSVFSAITEDTDIAIPIPPQKSFDVAKLVGAPPPPPKNPPPPKKGSKKKDKRANSKQINIELPNDENSDVINATSPQSLSRQVTNEKQNDDDDDDLLSFITTESNTIDVDDYSLASRSVMSAQSNKNDVVAPSPASTVTRLHSHTTKEDTGMIAESNATFFSNDEDVHTKDKKKGFLRKFFRGRGKTKTGVAQMDVIAESGSHESIPSGRDEAGKHASVSSKDEGEEGEVVDLDADSVATHTQHEAAVTSLQAPSQSFAQDPPDDQHGDPPQRSGRPLISPRSAKDKMQVIDVVENETGRSRIADFYGPTDDKDYLLQTITSTLSVDRSLYGGDISINQGLSVDPEADGDHPRILSTKALGAKEFKIEAYQEGRQPTPTSAEQLRVLMPTESVDPVGASPKLDSDTRGRAEVEEVFKEPAGASPLAWKLTHDDPFGASPCHAEELKKLDNVKDFEVARTESEDPPIAQDPQMSGGESDDPPLAEEPTEGNAGQNVEEVHKEAVEESMKETEFDVNHVEQEKDKNDAGIALNNVEETIEQKHDKTSESKLLVAPVESLKDVDPSLDENDQNANGSDFEPEQNENVPEASRAASDLSKEPVVEMLESDPVMVERSADENTAMLLSVSAAAFSNAETIAYLHELQGQPSPRHSWHSSKRRKDAVPTTPVQTQKKISKAILKAKLRGKYSKVQEPKRKKAPSPDEYTAENFDDTIERANRLERKDISKFQGFGYQSRFKGRKPTRKDAKTTTSASISASVSTTSTDGSHRNLKTENSKDIHHMTPGKIAAQAVAHVRTTKHNAKLESETKEHAQQKRREGKNRFRFRVPESEIKDPIQRASRRLLTKAALRIQNAARMYLAKREALDRMWAILAIQAYSRRWKCQAIYREKIDAIKSVQAVARALLVQKEIARRHDAAVTIQKTLRGYLAAAKVYDMVYCIVSIQSMMRGAYVRHMKEKRKALFAANAHRAIPMQSLVRSFIVRKELASRHSAASKMQSIWRMYVAKIDSQMRVVDIIVAQSVARRWLACRQAARIRNAPFFGPASQIQAAIRGRLGRKHHKKVLAAQQIQRVWRGFQAYTDYVFALVDIIVVQRKVRQWLAVRKANALRAEKISKLEVAATNIQKSWRGFWAFSQYIIVQYEITRLQAIVRGKLAREKYQFQLGCAIIIQAKARQYLARKKVTSEKLDSAMVLAKSEELREKNAAKRIQFWWRIVLEWTNEKKAALVIERFFINVKKEVEREVRRRRRRSSRSSTQRTERKRRESQPLPSRGSMSGKNHMVQFDKEMINRSQSAPRARRPPTYQTPTNRGRSRRMPSPSPRHLNREHQNWPVDSVLQLSASNVSEVSNITTPEALLRSSASFDRRQRGQRTATDYIQKYNKAEMYSDNRQGRGQQKRSESPAGQPVDQQSRHFFSDGRRTPSEQEGAVPRTDRKAAAALGQHGRRRSTSATPRGNRMPPSPHRLPPSPHRLPPSPHRQSPAHHRTLPSPGRNTPSPSRTQPSPRRVASSPRRSRQSPRRERLSNLPPVDLSKVGAIKRDETADTDSMSRSTASRSMYGNSRNPADERGYSKRQEFRDQPISYLGADYGEV